MRQSAKGAVIRLAKLVAPPRTRRRKWLRLIVVFFGLRASRAPDPSYYEWYHKRLFVNTADQLTRSPLLTVVVPMFNTPTTYLYDCVYSVVNQYYQNWELILVNASTQQDSRRQIEDCTQIDARIKVIDAGKNYGIAGNTNLGIKEAEGEYVCFMDHDDVLHRSALLRIAEVLQESSPALIYSDEDKLTEDGRWRHRPHFKPSWSPRMLENLNYITHLVAVRSAVAKSLKIRESFEGAQDYDFLLRLTDEYSDIVHIPEILYHWREAKSSTASDFSVKPKVLEAGIRALKDHFVRNRIRVSAITVDEGRPGYYKTKFYCDPKLHTVIRLKDDTTSRSLFDWEGYARSMGFKYLELTQKEIQDIDWEKEHFITLVRRNASPRDIEDLEQLFGAVEAFPDHIFTPTTTRGDRIVGRVFLGHESGEAPAFTGYNTTSDTCIGSTEWIRRIGRVEFATLTVHKSRAKEMHACINNGTLTAEKLILWTSSEFIEQPFDTIVKNAPSVKGSYNPNVEAVHTIYGVRR